MILGNIKKLKDSINVTRKVFKNEKGTCKKKKKEIRALTGRGGG